MVCFPQVQIKAQAELDRIVNGRLPDFDDMNDLPYLSAVVKEVLRLVGCFSGRKRSQVLSLTQMATSHSVR